MAAPGAGRLQALLSTLQSSSEATTVLNIVKLLDELLSAGTERRIHYLISEGGSEALLQALVNTASSGYPDYSVLLPLLHLLAKVGHRDRKVGQKAEKVGAVLLILSLLRLNVDHARRAAACLWVLRVFCFSASGAALLGNNRCLDVVFRLMAPRAAEHPERLVKAAVDAFAGLMCSRANGRRAATEGYIAGLLRLYEDWHHKDRDRTRITICRALLRCLNCAASNSVASAALLADGGLGLLFRTTQVCLASEELSPLVEPAVQLMRKCYPKSSVPLASEWSTCAFPLPPGTPTGQRGVPASSVKEPEEDSEGDAGRENGCDQVGDPRFTSSSRTCVPFEKLLRRTMVLVLSGEKHGGHIGEESLRETTVGGSGGSSTLWSQGDGNVVFTTRPSCRTLQDEDLEMDPNKLQTQPEPDRAPLDQLGQYARLCLELQHDFQDLDSRSGKEENSGDVISADDVHSTEIGQGDGDISDICLNGERGPCALAASPETHAPCGGGGKVCFPEEHLKAGDLHSSSFRRHDVVVGLLEKHEGRIRHHQGLHLYAAAAARTKSAAGDSVAAFPDYWGHDPPRGQEPMAVRQPNTQRKKVLEDIQRITCPDELMNTTVFDQEDPSPRVPEPADGLRFFSGFECGNLRKAIRVRRHEYDLILNADANSCENHQWFYFEVSGMESGVCYRFNVINCEKPDSQFNYGMQPVLFSVREALDGQPHWVRVGDNICYYRNHYCPRRGPKGSSYYTLTFSVIFKHSEDVCYLAYHYPYTYTALQTHLQILQESVDPHKIFFQQQSLCSTMGGNPCPVVTITARPASHSWTHLHQLRNRPYVVLTARVHPGESNASWMMKGSLEFLCSDDPVAEALREVYIFKVIPMLNPDGVVNGFSRCGLSGEDLNRRWKDPDPIVSPTIFHAKGLLYYLRSAGRSPLVFCDYHGHSRKKNVFLYGCGGKDDLWPPGRVPKSTGHQTIAKALDRLAPAFSLSGCSYVVEKSRELTARVVVWREMGVRNSYTMESTFNGCNQGIYKGMQLGTRELEEVGAHFCKSLLSLRRSFTVHCEKLLHHAPALLLLEDNPHDHTSHSSLEDDDPPCMETIEYYDDCDVERSGDELDSEINDNVCSSEEEEDDEGVEEDDEPQCDSLGVRGRAEH